MNQQQASWVRHWRGDFSAPPGRSVHGSTAGLAASGLLLIGCLLPLASTYVGLPDLSGGESALAVAVWLSALALGGGRPNGLDAIIVTLLLWELASAGGSIRKWCHIAAPGRP